MTSPEPPEEWRFAPPPVARRWRWFGVLVPVLALALIVGSIAWLVRSDRSDARGYLDDPEVTSAVARACGLMTSTVSGLRVAGPLPLQEAVLDDQTRAIEAMIDQIEELGPEAMSVDRPLEAWLADWGRLADARDEWSAQVGDGSDEPLPVPRDDDGDPITERMDRAADGWCRVPDVLLDPRAGEDIGV